MDITHIRRMNINQGRVKSNETNRLKGIRKFIKSTTKRGVIINEIIDDLIQTKYYEYIYNIFVEQFDTNDIDIKDFENKNLKINGLSFKDIEILFLFNFCIPEDLSKQYKGFNIEEHDLTFGS
jgi:hypothetical protein